MGPDVATLPRMDATTPRRHRTRRGTGTVVLVLAALMGCLAVRRSVRRVVVVGSSMAPTLLDGDRLVVLARPVGPPVVPAVGAVVAAVDPRDPDRVLVKRVSVVDRSAGTVELRGDDPGASTDSRDFGPVPLASLVGRAVYRYGPAGRTGPGPWPTGYDPS